MAELSCYVVMEKVVLIFLHLRCSGFFQFWVHTSKSLNAFWSRIWDEMLIYSVDVSSFFLFWHCELYHQWGSCIGLLDVVMIIMLGVAMQGYKQRNGKRRSETQLLGHFALKTIPSSQQILVAMWSLCKRLTVRTPELKAKNRLSSVQSSVCL